MGYVLMPSVVKPLTNPVNGLLAGDFAVGSIVKLMEGGVATDYLVVNQGIPSGSSLYDASCDGTWLLRKQCRDGIPFNSSSSGLNSYETSTIHEYLNGDFLNLLGTVEQTVIKQVKIPYRQMPNGSFTGEVMSGENGLSAKAFLLSGYELGWTTSDNYYFSEDGAILSYFIEGTDTPANSKRLAYYDGSPSIWWTRSPRIDSSSTVFCVYNDGSLCSYSIRIYSHYVRPTVIVPKTALFDKDTLILKGVA